MKICISSTGNSLDALVDPRFGRASFFLIVDSQTQEFEAIANSGVAYAHGAGISAAQLVADQGVEAIVTGNIGPNAFMVLDQTGIEIFAGVFQMNCRQALDLFNQGKLTKVSAATGPRFASPPPPPGGRGPGRGRRGRGGQGLGRRGN